MIPKKPVPPKGRDNYEPVKPEPPKGITRGSNRVLEFLLAFGVVIAFLIAIVGGILHSWGII